MPSAPLKACAAPGCPNRVVKGRCPEHARQGARLADEHRGSRHERGYTNAWVKYSKQRLAENPLCTDPFKIHGIGAFATCTDHIVPPWAGGDFWDPANHQSLCTSCNLRKASLDRTKYVPATGGAVKSLEEHALVPACEVRVHAVKMAGGG